MKNLFIFIFLFFGWSINSYSQNLGNLDLKYGFNKFTLESPFTNYQKDLTFLYDDEKTGVKYYHYNKKDISVFGFNNIEELTVGFYKEKLYTIDIVLSPQINPDLYPLILSKLEELFGYPNVIVPNDVDYGKWDTRTFMKDGVQWRTEKTLLGLHRVKCTSPTRPCTTNIFLFSFKLQNQINNDGF